MTNGPLIQLLYHSRRAAGTTDRTVVDNIALLSAAKSSLQGITGCLWFGATRFVQVLEGEAAAIDSLFESIRRDFRHYDVQCCRREAVEQRSFAAWTMASIEGDESEGVSRILTGFGVASPAAEPVPPARATVVRRIADLLAHREVVTEGR